MIARTVENKTVRLGVVPLHVRLSTHSVEECTVPAYTSSIVSVCQRISSKEYAIYPFEMCSFSMI